MDPSERQTYSSSHIPPQRVYNKQIVNNTFKQPFEPYVGAPLNQIVPPFPVSQTTPIVASQLTLQNQGFNTNVWAVPPMHQIFIAPAVTPLTNQTQISYITPNNLLSNVHLQNNSALQTSHPVTSRFNSMRLNTQSQGRPRISGMQIFNSNHLPTFYLKKNYAQRKIEKRVTDLRQILAEKRMLREQNRAKEDIEGNEEFAAEYSQHDTKYSTTVSRPAGQSRQENYHSDVEVDDSDWLEENMSVHGTKLKLNVTNLKNLANPDTNLDCWYIVADQNIFLNHLNFLNILFDSDDECNLMMPREVFSSLQAIVASGAESPRTVSRARRAIALFTQLLDAGTALIGEDPEDPQDRYLLNCCQNLMDQNYHVVLISNDPTLQGFKNDTLVPIFSIKEVKQVLAGPPKVDDCEKETLPIMITINNDFGQNKDTGTVHSVDSAVQSDLQELAPQKTSTETINNNSKVPTSDASIQTDFNTLHFDDLGLVTPETSQDNSDIDKNTQTDMIYPLFDNYNDNSQCERSVTQTDIIRSLLENDDTQCERSVTQTDIISPFFDNDDTQCERSVISESGNCNSDNKEIPLIRNSCDINKTDTTVTKTQYKWRRRKDATKPGTCDSRTTKTDENNLAIMFKNLSNMSRSETTLSPNIDEDNISSDTGSVRNTCKSLAVHVTFEETSTCGVISNTNTSVNTEVDVPLSLIMSQRSHHSNKPPANVMKSLTRQDSNKSHSSTMFEVRDENMETDLKTRSDEFVSRFVQIMEEILSEMLLKDPPYCDDSMPPPWSIQEAVQCTIRKFQDEYFVVDTAHKLANVLDKNTDDKGRIEAELPPHQFMEMYSYGVQLVEIFQSIQDCEDLQIASELLARLLHDILDPNMEASNNTTLDENADISENIHQVVMTTEAQELCENINTDEMTSEVQQCDITTANVTLNISTIANVESRQDIPQEVAEDIENNSSKSAHFLRKNVFYIKRSPQNFTSNSPTGDYRNFESQSLLNSRSPSVHTIPSPATNTPKIVRNFQVYPQFEKNFKMKNPSLQLQPSSLTVDVMDEILDFEGFEDEEYLLKGFNSIDNVNDYQDMVQHIKTLVSEPNTSCLHEKIDLFLSFVGTILLDLFAFCKQSTQELSDRRITKCNLKDILDKADESWSKVTRLCHTLERILNREPCELDKLSCPSNRSVLSKCFNHATLLLKCIFQLVNKTKKNMSTH